MLSQKAKWRLIEEKCAHHGVVPMIHHGKVFFGQKVRRPYRLGNQLVMAEFTEPITAFNDGDPWWKYLFLKLSHKIQTREEKAAFFLQHQDRETERLEAESEFKWKDVKESVRKAFVGSTDFAVPGLPKGD